MAECFKKKKGEKRQLMMLRENNWEEGQQERGVNAVITMTAEKKN